MKNAAELFKTKLSFNQLQIDLKFSNYRKYLHDSFLKQRTIKHMASQVSSNVHDELFFMKNTKAKKVSKEIFRKSN